MSESGDEEEEEDEDEPEAEGKKGSDLIPFFASKHDRIIEPSNCLLVHFDVLFNSNISGAEEQQFSCSTLVSKKHPGY